MGDPVTQIVALRQVNGKSEALIQWACSWNTMEKLAGQAVAQVLDTRMRNGIFEVLVQWCCTWTDVDDVLMSGDLWQPFLNSKAIEEAEKDDESGEDIGSLVGSKRGLVAIAGKAKKVRRSSRNKIPA